MSKDGWKEVNNVGEFPDDGSVHDWSVVKHFKSSEFSCKCGKCHGRYGVNFDLVLRLDALRKLFNGVIRINSGYRCDEHPETLKNPTSSHNHGEAVDIAVKTSASRFRLLQLIFNNHLFTRIGIGEDYLHLDIDEDKPQDLMWDYYAKK
jgi:hypothetical protein